MTAVLVLAVAANVACGMYANIGTQFFSRVDVDETAVNAAKETSLSVIEEVEAEGAVLLKNEDQALPLDQADAGQQKVNVFGWSSIDPIYGGNGSGAADESGNITRIQGLENAGLAVNPDPVSFYEGLGYSRLVENALGQFATGYNKIEAPVSAYSQELLDGARAYSDVALVVIRRIGGEGSDMPMDMSEYGGRADERYLELSPDEQAMVDMVSGMGFGKVVVLVNSSNAVTFHNQGPPGYLDDHAGRGGCAAGGGRALSDSSFPQTEQGLESRTDGSGGSGVKIPTCL